MRSRRSPARWLAPIALVACAVAVYSVVHGGASNDPPVRGGTPANAASKTTARTVASTSASRPTPQRPRTYTIQAGDTLSSIAQRTGLTLARLQELNPTLDARALQTGQRVNLSP